MKRGNKKVHVGDGNDNNKKVSGPRGGRPIVGRATEPGSSTGTTSRSRLGLSKASTTGSVLFSEWLTVTETTIISSQNSTHYTSRISLSSVDHRFLKRAVHLSLNRINDDSETAGQSEVARFGEGRILRSPADVGTRSHTSRRRDWRVC